MHFGISLLIESLQLLKRARAFTMGMLNAIFCLFLAFVSQKPPPSGIVKTWNCKIFSNTTTMPSYFYDGTIDYCIRFLICFILSLSSMSDTFSFSAFSLSSSQYFISLSLCELLSTLKLSLFMSVVGPPRWCVDRWVWFCGVFFFFFFAVTGA